MPGSALKVCVGGWWVVLRVNLVIAFGLGQAEQKFRNCSFSFVLQEHADQGSLHITIEKVLLGGHAAVHSSCMGLSLACVLFQQGVLGGQGHEPYQQVAHGGQGLSLGL